MQLLTRTSMMTTPPETPAAIAMAAAIAAAAELAKNGGFEQQQAPPKEEEPHWVVSSSPEPPEHRVLHDYEEDDEEDAEKRLARSRERNREHARRTRLRKKAQLEALQCKAKGLEEESQLLKQSVEECSIASILIDISSGSSNCVVTNTLVNVAGDSSTGTTSKMALVGGKRKRFVSTGDCEMTPQPLKLCIDGQVTLIGGGGTHINWKTGVYCGENGQQRKLTQEQLESLRRERNRMHAKMTRDRKKYFISSIEKTIEELETTNEKMRNALLEVAKHHSTSIVTPVSSPLVVPSNKRVVVPHGFSLTATN